MYACWFIASFHCLLSLAILLSLDKIQHLSPENLELARYRTTLIPRRLSGQDLDDLFIINPKSANVRT